MMRATKYILIVCVILNFIGHPIESKVIGWDYCTEEGHPFWLYVFKFGWPIPVVEYNQIWGCLSTPHEWFEFSWPGLIGSQIFWIVAIWIIDTYWPTDGCARAISVIQWKEAEYPEHFISASASVQQGFIQIHLDRLTVIDFFKEHLKSCKKCNTYNSYDCKIMKKAKQEISIRFRGYNDFINTISSFQKIMKWARTRPLEEKANDSISPKKL